jgi:hypothetical protein
MLVPAFLAPLAMPFALGAGTIALGVFVLEWMDRALTAARTRGNR